MIFDLLQYSFVQRALLAGVVLALLYAVLGVFVVVRKMSFWSEGIAHASLAGVAVALITGTQPLLVALVVAVLFAILMTQLEKRTNLSFDTLIGVLFTSFMALGLVIMNQVSGYQAELVSYLFGNILTISYVDLVITIVMTLVVLAYVMKYNKTLTTLSLNKEVSQVQGIRSDLHEQLFAIALAVAVVLGVKLVGIILVSALLIIPPAIAKLTSRSFYGFQMHAVMWSLLIVVVGLLISLLYNQPSGPVIILTGSALFLLTVARNHMK
ncbi:metal ABC transporter permease [Candidatus Falkowbacteria bacterium]|nr:metal ABC transporter permease [Candidatus Falkowbacteria bacterium]